MRVSWGNWYDFWYSDLSFFLDRPQLYHRYYVLFWLFTSIQRILENGFCSAHSWIIMSSSTSVPHHSHPNRLYISLVPNDTKARVHSPHFSPMIIIYQMNDLLLIFVIPIIIATYIHHSELSFTSTHHHSHINYHYSHTPHVIFFHSYCCHLIGLWKGKTTGIEPKREIVKKETNTTTPSSTYDIFSLPIHEADIPDLT